MSQNSFIKQYLAKQQELLRQRLEREAREAAETDGEYPIMVQIDDGVLHRDVDVQSLFWLTSQPSVDSSCICSIFI